jgi:hypothetical protein
MPKYKVECNEVWTRTVVVEAADEHDAERIVNGEDMPFGAGQIISDNTEYSHDSGDPEDWTITEVTSDNAG